MTTLQLILAFNVIIWALCTITSLAQKDGEVLLIPASLTALSGIGYILAHHTP